MTTKLYGGTKTEMERLLKDAEAYLATQGKTAKFSIDNLADVYTAINAIQQKLKIAGATSEEAEKTITGSLNSMKAAWKDLVTAIGRGDSIGQAIDNFMQSLSNFIANIVPAVKQALTGIGEVIAQVAPQLIQMLAETIISAIPALIEAIYNLVLGLAKGIVDGIKALFTGAELEKSVTIKTDTKSIDATTESVEALGEATEETAEKASGATASFDELNVINAKEDTSTTELGAPSIGGMPTITQPVEIQPKIAEQSDFQKKITKLFSKIKKLLQPVIDYFGRLIDITIEWVKSLDFTKIKKEFGGLTKSLSNAVGMIGATFGVIYTEFLLPLGDWLITDFTPVWIDALRAGVDMLSIAVGVLISAFKSFFDEIEPLTTFVSDILLLAFQAVQEVFESLSTTLIEKSSTINHIFKSLGEIIASLQPIFEVVFFVISEAVSVFGDLVGSVFGGVIDILSGVIDFLIGIFTADWERAWRGITDIFVGLWEVVKGVFLSLFDFIVGILTPIVNWIDKNVIQPIAEFFSWLWDEICAGFKAVVNFFIGMINGMIGCLEAFVNIFVKAINTVIDGMNSISFEIPDWVPGVGGERFGFNLSKISKVEFSRIPELAQGAVIPPNNRFLAVLGDQKSGTNIEAPLATIKQALAEVMRDYGGGGNQPIIVEIDGKEVFRAVKNAEMRYGSQIMVGGAY